MSQNKDNIYDILHTLHDLKLSFLSSGLAFKKEGDAYCIARSVGQVDVSSRQKAESVVDVVKEDVVIREIKKDVSVDIVKDLNEREAKIRGIASKLNSIDEIKDYLTNEASFCEIKKLAKNTVVCDGRSDAKIVLIGEAPGEDEDINGIPFCGRSGRLLNNVLKSIGLDRDVNLYITNTVFWRPPANRKPTDEEITLCRPFLFRLIELIKPEFLILCGGTAISCIAGHDGKISDLHGRVFDAKIGDMSIKASAIYHPSYLLRSPSFKKNAWIDMMSISKHIGHLL
ncbi:uracil-DNA glycosylase [Candidatus Deianiraea vastatrix]|uniref:Type-4 uracil-DNA glycosylase n=1 Tax=Candidatus Deianiraea vastatrix TaxID=2163644 RepID=A0A5B8XEH9_9RICK|nr:uracil-DNA glycosylase [Candidatus Deianiraea vastatrix]QED23722.1 Uracil DNA glycosylase superfamily protein [Candidatus Deianiraea vastatrix]